MRFYHSSKTHFFRPLIPGFIINFYVPKSFRKHLGGKTQHGEKMALLRDKRGKIWDVKIDLVNKFQFKDGWEKFCQDHNMQIGDFVLFRHRGYWVFDVWVLDPSACERELPAFDHETITMVQPRSSIDVTNYEPNTNNFRDEALEHHEGEQSEALERHEGEQSEAHKLVCNSQINPVVEDDVVRPPEAAKGSENNHEIQLGGTNDQQSTRGLREMPKKFGRYSTSVMRKGFSYRYFCKQCEKGFKSPQAVLGHLRWAHLRRKALSMEE